MPNAIKDMTIEELKHIIDESVANAFEDNIEDMIALSSKNYIKSIEGAREDYRNGNVVSLEDIEP